jgi:hypothetical protein
MTDVLGWHEAAKPTEWARVTRAAGIPGGANIEASRPTTSSFVDWVLAFVDERGVMGHAAAVPTVMAATEGIARGTPVVVRNAPVVARAAAEQVAPAVRIPGEGFGFPGRVEGGPAVLAPEAASNYRI